MISLRSQKILIWWGVLFGVMYFVAIAFCLHLLPTPSAQWSPTEIAQYYQGHSFRVRLGAAVAALTSGFLLPFVIVIIAQMYRHERLRDLSGFPVWTTLAGLAGALCTVIIAIPTNFLGAAAYSPERPPDITTAMHELGILSWLSGDQWAIFFPSAVAVACLIPNAVPNSPFRRWFGYLGIICALGGEPAVMSFLTRTGPFSWTGLLAYWIPMGVFVVWFPSATCCCTRQSTLRYGSRHRRAPKSFRRYSAATLFNEPQLAAALG